MVEDAKVGADETGATVTACLLIIGNEILSGRTQDKNLAFIGERLNGLGIRLTEARIIPDVEATIVDTLNEVRRHFDYVFTTGGIGPTHDDITADCVAKAFGVELDYDSRAVALMRERFAEHELNEARMRMTRIPKGAELVINKISKAPGFWIGNVIVMAGVPNIMQSMLDEAATKLRTGQRMLSESVRADTKEGDIGTELGEIAKAHSGVSIGSYPFFDEARGPNTNVVIRSRDAAQLAAAKSDVEEMLARVKATLAAHKAAG